MFGLLRKVRSLIAGSLSPEPRMRIGGSSSRDGLPPVLGVGDWSYGLLGYMADSGVAWYFDRR